MPDVAPKGLDEVSELIFSANDGRRVLRPAAVIPRDQAWFWTQEWQVRESEADLAAAARDCVNDDSDEAFLSSLDAS